MTTKSQPMANLLFFNYDLLQERMNSDISLEEQYVRAYIAYRAGNGIPGKSCFASIETISKDLGYSKNTARKHIRFLVAAKHIIELGYRSEYGTKQYTLNQNYDDWIQITKNFRNAYNNIESIKSDKRKDKVNTSTVEADFNPLSEVQNLNPNSLKEFNYENQENSNFGTQQENYLLVTETVKTPIGDGFAPVGFPPPPPPSFASQSQESSDSSIDWAEYDLGFETSSNFGGSFEAPEPVLNPPGTVIEGATTGTWDDDFDNVIEETATPVAEPQPTYNATPESFTQPALNKPARPGKSVFDLTPDVEDQLTLVEKLEVETEINNVAKEAETLKPEPETKEPDGRTSPLSQENKMLVLQVYGLEAAKYFDYPYLLLDFMNKKKEEWAKERREKEAARRAEQYEQQIQSQCTECSEPVVIDLWADAPIADENDPNRPPFIPEPEPVAPSLPPLPGSPGYEEMCRNEVPTIGIDIANPQRIIEFLEQSNVFYNNDRRHYEVIFKEEVMDRFFPLFAELMKNQTNPTTFDKFIEMSLIMTAASMGWEDDRYYSGKVKSLIEPWIPSKFQGEQYSHFTKEELLDVAKRDDIEWCEKLSFNDIMLQAEKVAFEAKEAGLSVEEYQKQQREEARKVANEIAAKEEKLEELPDDVF